MPWERERVPSSIIIVTSRRTADPCVTARYIAREQSLPPLQETNAGVTDASGPRRTRGRATLACARVPEVSTVNLFTPTGQPFA
jgi:hypothetical protein